MEIVKIMGLLLVSAFSAALLAGYKKEYSAAVAVAAGCIVSVFVLGKVYKPINDIFNILASFGFSGEYFSVALKALLVGYIAEFTADTCRDCGQVLLASKALFAGKAAIFLIALPVLADTFKTIYGIIK